MQALVQVFTSDRSDNLVSPPKQLDRGWEG